MKYTFNASAKGSIKRVITPPIPFTKPAVAAPKLADTLKIELKMNPTDNDSQTYTVQCPVFKTGMPEEFLNWNAQWEKIVVGQAITMGKAKHNMARTLL